MTQKIKLKKMVGTREGILCMTENTAFLLSFDEMSKYPNQPVPMGDEVVIESCGAGFATMTIGKTQMKFKEKRLLECNHL